MADLTKKATDTGSPPSGTREKILAAAMGEFAKNGLAGARVDLIASEAGVNKAMIYYYFQSKENLYREVVMSIVAERAGALSRDLTGEANLDSVLKQALDLHADIFYGKPEIARIYLRELADPNSKIVESIARTIRETGLPNQFTRVLADGARCGAYRPVDVRQAMISFITMSIGYYLMSSVFSKVWQFTEEPAFIEERKKAIVDLFLNGVKAR